jgi:dTDP-4-dehydrorhamnose 3,5-epimerase
LNIGSHAVKFTETALKGAFIIEPERIEDERGFFGRTFCRREFNTHGLNPDLLQCSVSFNRKRGTLRGMHFQVAPYAETKLVRCTRGAIYDVIIDLRPQSPTFRRWIAVHLSAENHLMVYIPERFAHGFQTLQDEAEVSYYISEFYSPEHVRGLRWNDPAFGIDWPIANPMISVRDQTHPEFET